MYDLKQINRFWYNFTMKIGCAQISTKYQHLDLQIDAIKKTDKLYYLGKYPQS